MKKHAFEKAYTMLVLFFIAFTFLCMLTLRIDVKDQKTKEGFEIVRNYSLKVVEDRRQPQKQCMDFLWNIQGVSDNYQEFMFYSFHQNVEIYLDGVLIYSMKPSQRNFFGDTPGCLWNRVVLREDDNGSDLKIRLIPVYESSMETIPDFYFGTENAITRNIMFHNLFPEILAIYAILLGIVFWLSSGFRFKAAEVANGLEYLGFFAILLGIWKVSDLQTMDLMFSRHLIVSLVPYFALMLMPVPFALYFRSLLQNKDHFLWSISVGISMGATILIVLLQLIHVADFRNMLTVVHIVLLETVLVCIYLAFDDIHQFGWSKELKRNLLCMSMCFAGILIDMGMYYVSRGTSVIMWGMCGFVAYTTVLGYHSFKETKVVLTKAYEAQELEKIAFHDQLTGLYNRTAYAHFTTAEGFEPAGCAVLMCDLNDLKKCNDTLGHEKGDEYIKQSAHIIEKAYSDKGRCYRMGGDEFCVVLNSCTMDEVKAMVARMREMVKQYNDASPDLKMQIACGYDFFDVRIDYDIGDTVRRADKMMYTEKFLMKQKNNL